MSIFQINFSTLWQQILPPALRQPAQNVWGASLLNPLQYNNQLFTDYISGSTYSAWTSTNTYNSGDRVIYSNRGIYDNISGSTAGILPTVSSAWTQVNTNYIGATERATYNAQKLTFEYALNRWFQVTGITEQSNFGSAYNNIYIQTLTASTAQFIMYANDAGSTNMYSNGSDGYMFSSFGGVQSNGFTIYVPNYIYTGITQSIVRSFADTLNIAGISYSVSGY